MFVRKERSLCNNLFLLQSILSGVATVTLEIRESELMNTYGTEKNKHIELVIITPVYFKQLGCSFKIHTFVFKEQTQYIGLLLYFSLVRHLGLKIWIVHLKSIAMCTT